MKWLIAYQVSVWLPADHEVLTLSSAEEESRSLLRAMFIPEPDSVGRLPNLNKNDIIFTVPPDCGQPAHASPGCALVL